MKPYLTNIKNKIMSSIMSSTPSKVLEYKGHKARGRSSFKHEHSMKLANWVIKQNKDPKRKNKFPTNSRTPDKEVFELWLSRRRGYKKALEKASKKLSPEEKEANQQYIDAFLSFQHHVEHATGKPMVELDRWWRKNIDPLLKAKEKKLAATVEVNVEDERSDDPIVRDASTQVDKPVTIDWDSNEILIQIINEQSEQIQKLKEEINYNEELRRYAYDDETIVV